MKRMILISHGPDTGKYLLSFKGIGSKRTIVMKRHSKGFYYPDYL